MDSFSCSFSGYRSENWMKNMLSAAVVMALQKLNPQETIIQPPMYVCLWLTYGSRCFQRALISKIGLDILIMKRPSVIHAALGITVTTVKGN